MNIEEFIKQEAPNDDVHDRAYAEQLRRVYNQYKYFPADQLNEVRKCFSNDNTHYTTAQYVITYELLKEK